MKTSVILTQTSQLKESIDSVLIETDSENVSDLITAAQKAEVTINALTNTTDLTSKQLTGDGFPEGCFVVFDLRQLTVKVDAFLTQLSALLQDGYQIGLINNLSKYSDDEIKKLKLYKIYLINSGQENTNQDATISDNKISDINGKLAKNRSLVEFRDFTNVPAPQAGARVGIGKDTSGLQGGPAIGYSTNGRDFYAAITPYGFTFRKRDAENMWRLLRPKQRDDIDSAVGETVKKEVALQQQGLSDAKSAAAEAVQRADEAVQKSTVASNAAASMSSAISEAKSDAVNAANIANAMQSNVNDQLKNLDSSNKRLDSATAEMAQYAKTAQQQGKDIAELKQANDSIRADVANTKGDVAQLKIDASAATAMASNNKSDIAQLQLTASNAALDLKNAKSDIASVSASADKINASLKDQDGRIATVEQTAKGIQTTVSDQSKDISTIKQDATGMKQTITNNQNQLAEINTNVNGLSTKVAGAAGKDFVESSIKQANDKINESIASINGNIQNITADINGIQSTVKNKADQTSVTQLNDVIQAQVTGKSAVANWDGKDIEDDLPSSSSRRILLAFNAGYHPKAGDAVTFSFDYSLDGDDSRDFNVGFSSGPENFWGKDVYHLKKKVQHFVYTATISDDDLASINDAIKRDGLIYIEAFIKDGDNEGKMHFTNIDLKVGGLQSKLSMLKDSIDLEVKNDDLLSRINLQAGQEIFQSKKIYLDADSVVFGKDSKAFIPDAAIEKLSLDKLTAGHLKIPIADEYGNQIEMGNSGIDVTSAPQDFKITDQDKSGNQNQFKFNITAKGIQLTNHIIYGKNNSEATAKSDDFRYVDMQPDALHHNDGQSDDTTYPSGMAMYIPIDYSSSLGPGSPGGFFGIGHEKKYNGNTTDKNIDVAYVTKETNGWKEGLNVRTTMYMQPNGADHGMKTTWVSWSSWDSGERYPAIVNDPYSYGGIAFPKSSKVTLFDAYGHAFWPTQNQGFYTGWGVN